MRRIWTAAALGAAGLLSACDGSSDNINLADSRMTSGLVDLSAANAGLSPAQSQVTDGIRLARQTTFGPTPQVLEQISKLGTDGWLDQQFAARGSTYADLAVARRIDYCKDVPCNRRYFSRTTVAMRFYANAVSAPDQLRQRVAFALSQMIVASEQEVRSAAGIAAFNQLFLDNAFGNYRTLLKAVTLNPYMGRYLNMAGSNKTAPSENYAREMLQLFSMGPNMLNQNGSPRRDATGGTVPNYGPDDIRGVARALTGWDRARIGNAAITNQLAGDDVKQMIPVPDRYDAGEKQFLGTRVPAGASQEASVDAVVDAAFNHPSTAPFVSRHLIVHLVTANPSPNYIGRVAAVFANNGQGIRGDLKAVVRAVLTDPEARTAPRNDRGKLKEPVLAMVSLARAIGMTTDGFAFAMRDTSLGQPVMNAPSVFNFYPIDYPLQGSATLYNPASKLLNSSTVLRLHNMMYEWTVRSDVATAEFKAPTGFGAASGTRSAWATWASFGDNVDAMVAGVDVLLLGNSITPAQRAALRTAALAINDKNSQVRARKRAQMLVYIAATSPQFLVDR
ncbi:Uncharacterized conserved protein, DUF1800 family [Sphingomonas sp. NFR04]|uniref:DUF1800 domain-containing protein n=1 Tax=Sphingomonas sp. NFR04 TaxID=1566283 RepID=UPI0008E557D5|nr:DUF1800 domain-containing protein [Sphingomonas sp. NFR04]SFJ15773.1 Uncharacterized conserved protein, DUF1800 family [Sphingomonas sp. NFR04]